MKLYSTLERHALALSVSACPPPVSALRVTPPIFATQWQESALTPAAAPVAAPATALVPSAHVAVEALAALEATGSVTSDLTVRVTEPGGVVLTDGSGAGVHIDQFHVASAAQLDQRGTSVQGITGRSAKQDMTAPKPNGGVRGIPPRGRPV